MRADAANMIADNPSTITITRTTYTIADGKRTGDTEELDDQVVRLYGKNTTELVREGDETRFVKRREVRMLCEHDADVIPHSNENEDVFDLGCTYRIMNTRDITWEGVVISRQCTLEELH